MVKYKKKKNAVIKWIPIFAGILLLAFIFLLQTEMDERNARKIADQTLKYACATCDRYDTYVRTEEAKDLKNLQEKAKMILMYESHGGAIRKDILDAYVADENLTGVIVTDAERNIVMESGECESSLFESQLQEKEIKEILEYSEKTYMERAEIEGALYDFAVIARKEKGGLILCYHKVELQLLGENDISIEGMLSGYLFKMDGMVFITDGKILLNDNPLHMQGQSVEGCSMEVSNEEMWKKGELTRVSYKGKHWFGKSMRYHKYMLYVLYPSAQVFATRTTMIAFGTAVYVFFLFILAFLRNQSTQTTMREMQKQFRIIRAVGSIYRMNVLIHLDTDEWEAFKMPGEIGAVLNHKKTASEMLDSYIQNFVSPETQSTYREFVDFHDIVERLKGEAFIAHIAEDQSGLRSYSILAPQQWDAQGNVKAVVLAVSKLEGLFPTSRTEAAVTTFRTL